MTLNELEHVLRLRDDVKIGHGVTDEAVKAAERTLNMTFPASLKEYLTRFGHIEVGHWELFGLGAQIPEYLDIVRVTNSERTEVGCPVPINLIPMLNDGRGNLYCMVTTGRKAGSIVFWDHEAGSKQHPHVEATALADWISGLLRELDSL